MGFSQRLEMRQGQSLVMTPQLLQAIKLLQLSHLDLAAYVDGELERNPLLERPEEDRDAPERAESAEADGASDDGDGETSDGEAGDPWPSEDRAATRAEIEGDLDTSLE
ncbi:MAG TPA: RNA polymerase sigma-54 factor, partial [Beijerinckiaceae bacterium]|nr:RNA polymerase sigma-54 factor [Beijerinckiaceae bacterium]